MFNKNDGIKFTNATLVIKPPSWKIVAIVERNCYFIVLCFLKPNFYLDGKRYAHFS